MPEEKKMIKNRESKKYSDSPRQNASSRAASSLSVQYPVVGKILEEVSQEGDRPGTEYSLGNAHDDQERK